MQSLPPISVGVELGKQRGWSMNIFHALQVVVDVRNTYEIRVGKFKRAVDPQTDSFRQFPAWVEENLEERTQEETAQTSYQDSQQPRSPRRIAMYCTGGIRCEKATSYLVNQGFDEVRLSHFNSALITSSKVTSPQMPSFYKQHKLLVSPHFPCSH